MRRTALLALVLLVYGGRFDARKDKGQDVPADVLEKLIEQLGHDDFVKREKATERLRKIGQPALKALKQAAGEHADAEVRSRSAELVRGIETELRGELLVIIGQPGYWLNRIVFTPDGKQAVATGGAVILYDLTTAREVRRCLEVGLARPGLALTRDGKYFFTGHQHDHVLRMGEVQTGKEVRSFEGHSDGINAVALSPDERLVVSGGLDKTLRLWDVKTGKQVRQFAGITEMVRSVDCSRDGRYVVSGHAGFGDGVVRLWDPSTGKELRRFEGHVSSVLGVAFSPDGKRALSCDSNCTVRLWRLPE